ELDADFDAVVIKQAPANEKALGNPALGGRQIIGGSTTTQGYFMPYRKAGAAAREMLITAAAKKWAVDPSTCRAENSTIIHDASNRRVTFGDVAIAASKLPIPAEPKLKDPSQFKLIGKTTPRRDTPSKVDGSALYGGDIQLPNLVNAAIVLSPVHGSTVASYDASVALKRPGVIKVVELNNIYGEFTGLAVIAKSFWQAKTAVESLQVTWDQNKDNLISSAEIARELRAGLDDDANARPQTRPEDAKKGDAPETFKTAAKKFEAVYEAPYLAHACMEPMVATALMTENEATIWVPTQKPAWMQRVLCELTGLPPEKVTINTTFIGGGFGRKWELDYPHQAMQLAMAMKGTPVRLTWTREQDIRHDYYRPAFAVRLRGGLDKDGKLIAMHGRASGQSIQSFQRTPVKPPFIDGSAVEGMVSHRYDIPNILSEYVEAKIRLPIGYWRSVGQSQNAFFSESAIDEMAHLVGKDAYQFRRDLLSGSGKERDLAALDAVAKMSGWGRKLPAGRGLGLAYIFGFRSFIAQAAEVEIKGDALRVVKVWTAIDAGRIIDPGQALAQVEGGVVWGLSAALFGQITVDKGAVMQSNFSEYEVLRLANMPEIETQLIESAATPSGTGEAGVPAVGPAVANAIFNATGQRIRKLPLLAAGLSVA
ncbi:MAG: xanthine dehydrogenase family protein molybdopterin-binding subunit, partial [Rhodospirillaceae bacterium]|nr:xanthine dehydrogenase family protein molybdopterin-binding subunit [Rhodospirillaceae bacterium]